MAKKGFKKQRLSAKSGKYERALRLAQKNKKSPPRTAYELLVAADKEGDARATYALATWYLFGSPFTPVKKSEAIRLLKKATEGGVADAAHDLAVAYEKGDGVKKSLNQAFELNMYAALLGDAQSFYEVGRMYHYGIGVSRNRRLAKHWLEKAETLGIKE
jgi:TPR repeat protein